MRAAGSLLAASLAAAPALGQAPSAPAPPRGCVVTIDSVGRQGNFTQLSSGQYQFFAGGGILGRCRDQPTTMSSDSVAWFSDRGELRLLGRVHFRDSTSLLDADRVTYWVRQERLVAEGNVYTQNTRSGSDLRGPNLDYLRAVPPVRDTAELRATRRPTIHFFTARDSAARGDSANPFVVVADRVRMRGSDRMWGGGRVTVDRTDLAGRADSAELDLTRNSGALRGAPELTAGRADGYRLTGWEIRFNLTDERELRRIVSAGAADARGQDWRLQADTIDLALDSGTVVRAQAWGRMSRPSAVSGTNTIVADSLDIDMPRQVVRLVRAFGRGRATSLPDSAAAEPDWLVGDSLHAAFAVRDTAQRRSALEHLTAFGAARAYYHVENAEQPAGPRGVNYSRGDRIAILMRGSKARTVDIVGQVDGIYLEPLPPPLPQADSARAGAGRAAAPGTGTPPPARPPARTP